MFHYASGESHATFAHTEFKPLFIEDVLASMSAQQRDKAKEICSDNKECLFDFAVTGQLFKDEAQTYRLRWVYDVAYLSSS